MNIFDLTTPFNFGGKTMKLLFKLTVKIFIVFNIIMFALAAQAEILSSEAKISVKLDDGTDVVLYGAVSSNANAKVSYYYLPPRLTISTTDDDRPEFLFMKFITDESEDQGGVSGGILHFLVKWGLSTEQEEELREIIEGDFKGKLAGAATMYPSSEDGPSFYVVSGTLSDSEMRSSIVTSGQASLVPGGKAAAAARLDGKGAQLLGRTFEEDTAIADVTAVFNMAYQLQIPAAKGFVRIDWSKIQIDRDIINIEYKREVVKDATTTRRCFILCWDSSSDDYSYSYDEMRDQFSYLEEKKYITFEFTENYADERVNTIRDAFISYFTDQMTTSTMPAVAPPAEEDDESDDELNVRQGAGYSYDVNKIKTSIERGVQEFNMEYKLAVQYPFQVVGNMKSWYAEASSDPNAIQSVVLADPFFKRRDIVLMLAGDMKDMFAEHIDMVTVNIEKDRPGEFPFKASHTFTEEYFTQHGSTANLTYARSDNARADRNGYNYEVNWNFRDGETYTKPMTQADWEGVTLSAPIEGRTIELEASPDELEALKITRVTAQVRYPVLGKEQETNLHVSAASGVPLVENKIFLDKDAPGYVYRLIFNHKVEGRLATDWSARVSDDYIYAVIPEELQNSLLEEIANTVIEKAKDAVLEEADEQLSRFDSLLGGE